MNLTPIREEEPPIPPEPPKPKPIVLNGRNAIEIDDSDSENSDEGGDDSDEEKPMVVAEVNNQASEMRDSVQDSNNAMTMEIVNVIGSGSEMRRQQNPRSVFIYSEYTNSGPKLLISKATKL